MYKRILLKYISRIYMDLSHSGDARTARVVANGPALQDLLLPMYDVDDLRAIVGGLFDGDAHFQRGKEAEIVRLRASRDAHFGNVARLRADVQRQADGQRGGAERATSTLSGGETFLVSLALALALSLHINLRGQPLGFFFLDEGFGTLDERLLGTVMDALTMLARDNFSIGVISHVSALKERIPAQLIVSGGPHGSNAHIEFG